MSGDGGALRNIYECIRSAAGTAGIKKAEFYIGTVKTVAEADRICTVELIDCEGDLTVEASLSPEDNDGFILVPAVDSTVQACIYADNSCYISMWSDIDKVICVIDSENKFVFDKNGLILNDGLNGGLINITTLTTDLNTLVTTLNSNLTPIAAAITALTGTYVPVPAVPFIQTSFEDTKIKH